MRLVLVLLGAGQVFKEVLILPEHDESMTCFAFPCFGCAQHSTACDSSRTAITSLSSGSWLRLALAFAFEAYLAWSVPDQPELGP